MDGSVVVWPSEETTEHALLSGLLASSRATACVSALLQYFPSLGHVSQPRRPSFAPLV